MNEQKTYQDGLVEGRKEGARDENIRRTIVHLRHLMHGLGISLEQAMTLLQIPKSEREIYRRTFAAQKIQKNFR